MATMEIPNPQVVLEISRCWDCGRWYGVERGRDGRCPVCAKQDIARALDRADAAERSSRALRGAVTRLAKARKAARR